jgi:hypothetical protein
LRVSPQRGWQQVISRHLEFNGWFVDPPTRGSISAVKSVSDGKVKLRALINCLDWSSDGLPKALGASLELKVVEIEEFLGSLGLNSGVSLLVNLGGQSVDPAFKHGYFQLSNGAGFEANLNRFIELFEVHLGALAKGAFTSSSVFESSIPPVRLPPKSSMIEIHWSIRRLAYLVLSRRHKEARQQVKNIEKMSANFRGLPSPDNPLEQNLRAMEAKTFVAIESALPIIMSHSVD